MQVNINKKLFYILLTIIFLIIAAQILIVKFGKKESEQDIQKGDRLEILQFHGNIKCASCTTLSDNINAVLDEKFTDKKEQNKIVYKLINIDLAKNQQIVQKYNAKDGNVYFNVINGDEETAIAEYSIWGYIYDKEGFSSYLENKINSLLN